MLALVVTDLSFAENEKSNSKLPECNKWSFLRWDECVGTRKYDREQTIYTGEFRKGFANGRGKMIYEGGWYYEGEFVNGLPNGNGAQFDSTGRKFFEGMFSKDLRHGMGTYFFKKDDPHNRQMIRGNFDSGSLTKGQITYKNGDIYDGEVDEDFVAYGRGVATFADGRDKLEGIFKDGVHQKGLQSKAELVAQSYPYYAEIECVAPDGGRAPPISCFHDANIGFFYVRNGNGKTEEYGVVTQKDIPSKIMLEKTFFIGARNAHQHLVLSVEVFDTVTKKSLFYKRVGRFGVIEVSN